MNAYEKCAQDCSIAKSLMQERYGEDVSGSDGRILDALEEAESLLLRVLWERKELKELAEKLKQEPKGINWAMSDEFRNGMRQAYANTARILHGRIFQFDLDAQS